MEIRARPSASMRLDMSRPVLITHLAPRAWRSPMRDSTDLGIGGFSNSANSVPSKSVEISLMGALICFGLRIGSSGNTARAYLIEAMSATQFPSGTLAGRGTHCKFHYDENLLRAGPVKD